MKNFNKAMKTAFRLCPGGIIINTIAKICQSLLPFVFLYFSGRLIDELTLGAEMKTVMTTVYWFLGLTFALGIINAFCTPCIKRLGNIMYEKLMTSVTRKDFSLSYSTLEKKEVKELLQKALDGTNGSGDLGSFAITNVGSVLKAGLCLIYGIILFSSCFSSIPSSSKDSWFLFFNNPYSFLTIIGAIVLSLVFIFIGMKRISKFSYDFYLKNAEINTRLSYFFVLTSDEKYAKDIRDYQMENMLGEAIEEEHRKAVKTYNVFVRKETFYKVIMAIIPIILLGLSYYFVGGKAYFDIITVGQAVTIVGAISAFQASLLDLILNLVEASTKLKYLSAYFDYLELPEEEGEKGQDLPEGNPVIAFHHVYFRYPNASNYALKDVSFTIPLNKKLAIVGPNGAGKSTIIKLIGRLYKPEKGEITLNGVNISDLKDDEYQKLLAILFQDFSLLAFTVGQDVASSLEYDRKKTEHCLDLTGFNYQDKLLLPCGLDTYVTSEMAPGKHFSGGELQKISIARALYKDSPLILLDEPTSALDPKSEQEVYDSIAKLIHNKTALFISHRMSSTRFCDEIIVLNHGEIEEEGTHEELMKKQGLYHTLFEEQAKYYL